jgi:hypothetical protein
MDTILDIVLSIFIVGLVGFVVQGLIFKYVPVGFKGLLSAILIYAPIAYVIDKLRIPFLSFPFELIAIWCLIPTFFYFFPKSNDSRIIALEDEIQTLKIEIENLKQGKNAKHILSASSEFARE